MKRMYSAAALLLTLCLCLTLSACGGKEEKTALSLSIQGQTVKGDANVADYLKAFGDGYTYSEAISCAYDGMDKIYSYPGFNIYTYPKDDADYVLEVELTDDTYATSDGIKVGMSKDEVIKAYGNAYFMEGMNLTYNAANDQSDTAAPTLYFTLKNDTVTLIGITGTSVE